MTPTPQWAPLAAALRERRAVAVRYHGRRRVVCPHALGWKSGRALLLAYQVGGETSAGALDADPTKRWRCLFVDEIELVTPADEAPWRSADNYNPSRPFHAIEDVALCV